MVADSIDLNRNKSGLSTFCQKDVVDVLLALHETLELDRLDAVDLSGGVEGMDHWARDVFFSLELFVDR